jgi:hypothetical protein
MAPQGGVSHLDDLDRLYATVRAVNGDRDLGRWSRIEFDHFSDAGTPGYRRNSTHHSQKPGVCRMTNASAIRSR